jgi:hypothetical protein
MIWHFLFASLAHVLPLVKPRKQQAEQAEQEVGRGESLKWRRAGRVTVRCGTALARERAVLLALGSCRA